MRALKSIKNNQSKKEIMNTLIKFIITSIVSILLLSCNFSIKLGDGTDGNGNVVSVDRAISKDFSSIKVSEGIDLYITQSTDVSLSVEADENLHDIIMTEVENDILRIYTDVNIRRATSKKVKLNIEDISAIKATSGSYVYSTNALDVDDMEINTTSGANVDLNVNSNTLNCHSTSGSNIKLIGKTNKLIASATSGSNIKASEFKATDSNVKATSGANISINTTNELTARATSGGDIKYSGNPDKVNKSDSSSGRIRKQ